MTYDSLGIRPCELLLPAAHVPPETWACVACDQYTSQPEYWQEAAALVGNAPSCLHLVLPECYLPETEARVPRIHGEMAKYLADGTLQTQTADGFILVERTTESGSRLGLVCAADLEQYDFTGKKCLIRPTEQTITARLPARLTIRREAPLELSEGEHQLRAVGQIRIPEFMSFVELVRQLVMPCNRSLNNLREEGHEECKFKDILICIDFISVQI